MSKGAQARYDAKTARRVCLKLNKKTDADVLQRLDEVESKQGYIKRLIREDIAREIFPSVQNDKVEDTEGNSLLRRE